LPGIYLQTMKKLKPNQNSIRLDIFISQKLSLTRSKTQKLIKQSFITVNSKTVRASYLLNETDEILIDETAINQEPESLDTPLDKDIEIIYEDNDLAIINKPPGLVVHPNYHQKTNTLVDIIKHKFKTLSQLNGADRAGIVHRLDKFTEGLMIITKNDNTHEKISQMFKDRKITKKYYAVVKGNLANDELEISLPIGRHKTKRKQMSTAACLKSKAKDAITFIKVLKRYQTKTLLEITPKTGRTHQIRVHLAHIGHPVLGDPLYSKKSNKTQSGQLLQAFHLSFLHPVINKQMSFELPITSRLAHISIAASNKD
jgi:23S rRNA pseudouridine1911/1915/1917 synthase